MSAQEPAKDLDPIDRTSGGDEEDTRLLKNMAQRAQGYLGSFPWCAVILNGWFGGGVDGIFVATMKVHQPRTVPSHGYDGTYPLLQNKGIPIFGYDAPAERFMAFNLDASGGNAAKFRRFTGKERDAESGLDYFRARYFGSALGRFTSPDPLMASANAGNPQSWNRYSYGLNNPLRFIDPDGMDVPAACAGDKNCQIVVKVNVLYDQTVNNGKGFTDDQKKAFETDQIAKAQKDFGNSNIKLDVTYTQGSYTVDENGKTHVDGLNKDALNIVASTVIPDEAHGANGISTQAGGTALTFLRINDLSSTNWFMGSATTEHEMGHQFLGDPFGTNRNFFTNITRDANIDSRNTFQSMGISQSGYREGLEPRRYAVPANPEANKPQK